MTTDTLTTEMLEMALAESIAETEHIHPAHALNRVRLAVEIAARLHRTGTMEERLDALKRATRLDGSPVSEATKDLALRMWNATF